MVRLWEKSERAHRHTHTHTLIHSVWHLERESTHLLQRKKKTDNLIILAVV